MIEESSELPEWTEEERRLLASARIDGPSRGSLPRVVNAATAAVLATVATPAAALTLGGKAGTLLGLGKPLGLVKFLAVVTLVGGAAVGVSTWQRTRPTEPGPVAAASRPVVNREPEVRAAPPAEPVVPALEPTSASIPAKAPRATLLRPEPSAATQPDLSRDIAALDAARQALRAGRPGDALAALDRYDAEFGKSGALRVESRVLRIEATSRAGDTARAQTLARAFLKQNPNSPYAARVKAILEP